jgi:6-pyruvoyltetrahydropterin/6-carboxytetrahydropterin synthase
MADYKITVERDDLVFAAGHFITYSGRCETLHGHNYRVSVELEGELDENAHVWDFGSLRRVTRKLLDELDRKTLLPLDNPALQVTEEGQGVEVVYKEGRYVFPRRDVVLLPVQNTSAETLARYLAAKLREELVSLGGDRLTALAVGVEESVGQTAWYRDRLTK